ARLPRGQDLGARTAGVRLRPRARADPGVATKDGRARPGALALIELRSVHKTFGDAAGEPVHALRGLDLTVRDGETHCLLGTSGCGKTTALRLVNRLEEPDAGVV